MPAVNASLWPVESKFVFNESCQTSFTGSGPLLSVSCSITKSQCIVTEHTALFFLNRLPQLLHQRSNIIFENEQGQKQKDNAALTDIQNLINYLRVFTVDTIALVVWRMSAKYLMTSQRQPTFS